MFYLYMKHPHNYDYDWSLGHSSIDVLASIFGHKVRHVTNNHSVILGHDITRIEFENDSDRLFFMLKHSDILVTKETVMGDSYSRRWVEREERDLVD